MLIPVLWACAAGAIDLDDGGGDPARLTRDDPGARVHDVPLKGDPLKPPPGGEKAAITLHQVYAMSFGTLCDNDGYVVLDHNDTIVEDPDLLVYGGTPFSAEITLTGDPFTSVRIGATSPGATGMTLSDFSSNLGLLPLTGVVLDASGELTLHLGARLTLSVAAEPGANQTIGYTLTAIYE